MKKYIVLSLTVCVCLSFAACGKYWEDTGMFLEIEKEIKLAEPTAPGNILSIVQFGNYLYAAGGKIYSKGINAGQGWSQDSSAPKQVIRLAVGYDSNTEYLYALCANDDLYCCSTTTGWMRVSVSGTILTIFSNNAVSVEADVSNKAYVTTDSGCFELTGSTVGSAVTDNGASSSSLAAAYISSGSATHFSDSAAFTSDGSHTFSPGDTGISNVTALWACGDILYIGTRSGAQKMNISSTGELQSATAIDGSNAAAAIGSYRIGTIFAHKQGTRLAIYASTIGTTQLQGTKKNGLWGYYDDRGNWNWE